MPMQTNKKIMRKKFNYYKMYCAGLLLSLASSNVFSQNENINQLTHQFQQSQLQSFQEKVFVHTDKQFYVAGETIWFKLYDVDGYEHKPFTHTKVAYVEVVGKDQKPILQARVAIDSGVGYGSLQIPSFTNSGNYKFRAYTNWMKNFSPDFYYAQQLTIINTLRTTPINDGIQKKGYAVQFFPEGGNLVSGLPSKIAFKVTSQNGESISCSGVVINDKKDTVIAFKTLRFGTGAFSLTPENDESYYAVLKINDSVIIQKLPEAFKKGYTMSVADNDDRTIKVTVRCSEKSATMPVYLVVHTRQIIKSAQVNNLNQGETSFTVGKEILGDGISHFTVFDFERKPLCERLYFKRPTNALIIQARTDQVNYQQRKKVNVDMLTTDISGHALPGNLSAAVVLIDSLQSISQVNIINYLLLTSDLNGKIESPEYFFENSEPETKEAADNLMLTQGWSRFKWEDVVGHKTPAFEYLPETEGPLINGTVTDKITGQPLQHVTTFLSVPGNRFELGTAISNSTGAVRFNMNRFYGKTDIILQTNKLKDSSYRIEITNPFSDKFSTPAADLFFSKKWEHLLLEHSINAQVENSYLTDKKRHYATPENNDSTSFYGKPTLHFNLDDYTRFPTMEEVMREYVNDVRVRKEADKFNFRVRDILFNIYFEDEPLLLIDGVPVHNATKVISLDPLKIKSIDVVSHRFYKGAVITDGIVSYKTYNGDLAGYQLDPGAVVLEYEGLQKQKEFYSPVYQNNDEINSRIPDFRNVLSWSPEIKTNAKGKSSFSFYTSDLRGNYTIIIQGLTAQGLPGITTVNFTVD
jgi:hypothetical protein